MAKPGPKPGTHHAGTFKKGQPSANPGGRPKLAEGFREEIRNDESLRKLLYDIAHGRAKVTEQRRHTLLWMLDQGFGRAPQHVTVDGKVTLEDAAKEIREFLRQFPEVEVRLDAWLAEKAAKEAVL